MIYFLLPAYNEGNAIASLIEAIHRGMTEKTLPHRIIVVNDGSKDNTAEVLDGLAKRYPMEVIHHPVNRGCGQAFTTGFSALYKVLKNDDFVISMDADNTHKMKTVELMLARLNDGYEVIVASMFVTGGMMVGAPFYRFFLSYACNFIYRVLFHVKGIREYTGFFRGYRGEALLKLNELYGDRLITSRGFSCMAEVLVKCRRATLIMTEVPMILRYDHKGSLSSLRVIPTIREHLKIILGNVFDRKIF